MARSVDEIEDEILAARAADPYLSQLTPSKTGITTLWAGITAIAINKFEQLQDYFKVVLEAIAAKAAPGTSKWLRDRVLKFQFGDIVELNQADFTIGYPVVDEKKQIIKACAVSQGSLGVVTIKVAKDTPLKKLSGPELDALKSYVNAIQFAGVKIDTLTMEADQLYIEADVYANIQRGATLIKADVIAAINAYLLNLEFDGTVYANKVVDAIQGVEGVNDVVIHTMRLRQDTDAPEGGPNTRYMIQSNAIVNRSLNTFAGYIVSETTANMTLDDTIVIKVG